LAYPVQGSSKKNNGGGGREFRGRKWDSMHQRELLKRGKYGSFVQIRQGGTKGKGATLENSRPRDSRQGTKQITGCDAARMGMVTHQRSAHVKTSAQWGGEKKH